MSACSCYSSEIIGGMTKGPHIARKPGYECCVCSKPVRPGQSCVDQSFLFADDDSGAFTRAHTLCWHLQQRHKARICFDTDDVGSPVWFGGCGDIEDMAEDAFARSDDPFWRDWLLIYEMTWDLDGVES